MPTNADAHRTTVVRAAMSARRSAGTRAARDIDNLGVGRPARAMVSGTHSCKPAPAPVRCVDVRWSACAPVPRYPPAMPKLTPKIILEGTRLTHKTDLAFALNEHPAIVGPRRYRYHSPVISAEWCGFTPEPWGRGPITFDGPEEEARALAVFDAWARLIELQPHYSWIIDRFHLSARAYQLQAHGIDVDFGWLEERLAALDVHVVLCTRRDGWEAAREERLLVSGNPSQYDDLDAFRREQDLLYRLADESVLRVLEVDMTGGDIDGACLQIADVDGVDRRPVAA